MRIGPVALRRSIPDPSGPIEPSFQCAIQIYTRFQPEKSIRENLERILGSEFSDTLLAEPQVPKVVDIMEALRRSLEARKPVQRERAPANKAPRRKRA